MTDVVLKSSAASLTVSLTNGGRFSSLVIAGLDVLGRGGDRLVDWGCYPMAPYAGRIRFGRLVWEGRRHQLPIQLAPHAIHGVTIDRPWQVLDVTATTASLRCDFDTRWPWRGHAVQHLRLTEQALDAVLEVHSDAEPMPAWTGYHPWFARRLSRGKPIRLSVPAAGLLRKDADGMPSSEIVPVGDGPFDDCFAEVAWPAELVWEGALALSVNASTRWAVVYDQKPDAVCVEPQTAPPNAVQLGMAATVTADHPLTMSTSWVWRDA